MFFLYKLIGSLSVPPGLFILAAAAAFLFRKKGCRIFSRLLVCFSLLLFYIMSTPAGALLFTGPLESRCENSLPPDKAAAAFLVLAGGSSYDEEGAFAAPSPITLDRIFCAVRAASSRPGKSIMIMSGGNIFSCDGSSEARAMAAAARDMGWREEMIIEDGSRTTAENINNTAKMLEDRSVKDIVIVTSAYHMPRAAMIAKERLSGARLYTYASGRMADPAFRGLWSFLPEGGCFAVSCAGIREYAGIAAHKAASLFKHAAGRS